VGRKEKKKTFSLFAIPLQERARRGNYAQNIAGRRVRFGKQRRKRRVLRRVGGGRVKNLGSDSVSPCIASSPMCGAPKKEEGSHERGGFSRGEVRRDSTKKGGASSTVRLL